MKKVEQLEIEEVKKPEKSQKKSFFKKYIIYILLSIIIIALLVALILVIVLPDSNNNTSTIKPYTTTNIPTITNVLTTTNVKSTTTTLGVTITTGSIESITTSTQINKTTTSGTITSTTTTTTTHVYSLDSRINCLPWIQSIDDSILQNECNKNPNCIYEKSNNDNIPSCFYNKNSYKLKLIESKETELGNTYLFSDSSKQIRIDFEYLDNEVVRFKVI